MQSRCDMHRDEAGAPERLFRGAASLTAHLTRFAHYSVGLRLIRDACKRGRHQGGRSIAD
jgi:hypothetical protein